MWLALAVFSVFWIIGSRRLNGNTWPETLAALLLQLAVLVLLGWLFPGWVWKVALLAYLTFPWWVAAFRLSRSTRFPAGTDYQPYDPERHAVAPQLLDLMERDARALEAAGLVRLGTFWLHDGAQVTTLQVPMESADGHEGMMLTAVEAVVGEGTETEVRDTSVDCSYGSYFADGRRLVVSWLEYPSPAFVPGTILERLPSVRDPLRLMAFARAYRARYLPDARTVPLRDGVAPIDFMKLIERRNFQAQVRAGRLRQLPDGGYTDTLPGLLLRMLGQSFPFRQIARLRLRLRERRLMRRLQMTPEPPPRVSEWFEAMDLHGASVVAVALVLLLPVPPLPPMILPLPASGVEFASAFRPERPYRVPDGFMVPADFPGAVRALERLAGTPATPLEVEDAYTGEPRRADGVEVAVAADQADAFLQAAAPLFRARGFLLFRHENTFGIGGAPEYIGLYPRVDVFEVMRVVGTNGNNYGIGPDSVVAWFTRLQARHPFLVTGIAHDALEGRFFIPPDAAEARVLADEFHAFCPDVVTQGAGSVRALAAEIRRGIVYCWWD